MIKTISFIGSGNVATQFALAFKSVGFQINYIHSRNEVTGEQLAKKVKATFIESISKLKKCDLIMICIHDDNIKDVIHLLPNTLIIHTSGSTSLEVFTKKKNYGVIYPLQSLSKNTHVDFTHVPICIEANTTKNCIGIITWMHTFSPAKMWIAGLNILKKPLCHFHTQFNAEIPWNDIDMDFMNLNQSAHGDREFGFMMSRMRQKRKVWGLACNVSRWRRETKKGGTGLVRPLTC